MRSATKKFGVAGISSSSSPQSRGRSATGAVVAHDAGDAVLAARAVVQREIGVLVEDHRGEALLQAACTVQHEVTVVYGGAGGGGGKGIGEPHDNDSDKGAGGGAWRSLA
ncbi:MAG: hypothetical protein H0W96_15665 [Solirubrobacterales bacterium]|nr:hypothetical protein [Solirubrobacterales bacterium]